MTPIVVGLIVLPVLACGPLASRSLAFLPTASNAETSISPANEGEEVCAPIPTSIPVAPKLPGTFPSIPAAMRDRANQCPSGYMPVMRGVTRPVSNVVEGARTNASAPPYQYEGNGAECKLGTCYNHAGFTFRPLEKWNGKEYFQGGFLGMTQWQPYVDEAEGAQHSLAEVLVGGFNSSGSIEDTIELGWTVDRTGVNGSDHTNPHIFSYFTNKGYATGSGCYDYGCGLQYYPNQYGITAGTQVAGNGAMGDYEIFQSGSSWFLYYDGVPIGYYPDALFYGNMNRGVGLLEGYGEVASPNPTGGCTQMGNGINAEYSSAATLNAFEGVRASGELIADPGGPGYYGGTSTDC